MTDYDPQPGRKPPEQPKLSTAQPTIQKAAATAEFVHEIDTIQYDELHQGPCITCMQSRRTTVSGSLGSDSRWPRFGGRVARMACIPRCRCR